MRVLVTLLASFILALGLLGAGLTLLHTLPTKNRPTDPGIQLQIPADLRVFPHPLAPRRQGAGPSDASFRREVQGELRLSGQIQDAGKTQLGLKLIRVDGGVGLFLRRTQLGADRMFQFEGLAAGRYQLIVHESRSGQILLDRAVLLEADRKLELSLPDASMERELIFSLEGGELQEGAILVLENGRFFHQRVRGQAGGHFLAKGLPVGKFRYTIRGRRGPKADHLSWKGTLRVVARAGIEPIPPLKIPLGEAEKDPVDDGDR